MHHKKRKAISFISGKIVSQKNTSSLYCYTEGSYTNYSGPVGERINVFDYERGNYLTGRLNNIFDYASGQYIQLKIDGNKFKGFDYETGTYFSGTVNNNNVTFFDYQDGKYYNLSV